MTDPRLSIIPAAAVLDKRLKARDLQVLCLFGRHTDKRGWCTRSQVKMAKEIGCARSTVQGSIERLVEAGWIQRRMRKVPGEEGSRDSAHEYRVVLDVPDDTQDVVSTPADIAAPPADSGSAPPADSGSAPINDSSLTKPSLRSGSAREANKFDGLLDQLLEAAGISGFRDEKSPQLMNLAPIMGLIEAGFDFKTDILPAIREKCANGFRPRSWSYFVEIVRERAGVRREAASIPKTNAAQVVRDWPDEKWQRILNYSRNRGEWLNTYGPPPFADGCLVPAHLIVDGDRNLTRVAA